MVAWEEIRHQVAIAGRVTDAQTGRAIGGAQVRITTAPPAFTDRLATRAIEHGAGWATMVERPDRTRAAADGHFHFLDLPDGPYTLTASLPGAGTRYGAAQVAVRVSRDGAGNITMAAANIALPPTTLKGQITAQDAEGTGGIEDTNPVAMAEVLVKGSGERAFSNGQGKYLLTGLEAGTRERTVVVSAQGYQPASRIALLAGAGTEQVLNFALLPSAFNPTRIAGCKLWLKADAITGLRANDPVATWLDGSGNANHATQTVESKKPTYKTNVINGKPVVRFDGNDDSLSLSFSESATDHTFFFVYDQTPRGGHDNYLFDAQRGRLALDSADSTLPYSIRWNDGTWRTIAQAVAGKVILTWVFSGTTGEVFRNGTSLGSAVYRPKSLGGAIALGSNHLGIRNNLEADMAEVIYYSRALSTADRQRVQRYLSNRYAIPLA